MELKAVVDKLLADLRAIGREAASEFEGKFDELKDTVNDKGTELVDTLATRYTGVVKSVDAEIAAGKERNKGLVAKVADAIGGAIKAIVELGRMLMGVLRKAVSAIGAFPERPDRVPRQPGHRRRRWPETVHAQRSPPPGRRRAGLAPGHRRRDRPATEVPGRVRVVADA